MRILHLLSYHLVTGPAEPVLNLAAAQRREGHDARLACDTVRRGDLRRRAEELGIPVEGGLALCTKSGPILLMRDLLALKRLWREGTMDILHAHSSHDHTLAALARFRRSRTHLVRTLHAERSLSVRRDWQLRHTDGLIAVADRFRRALGDRGVLPGERIVAIEGAVDSQIYSPGPGGDGLRREAGVPADAPVAGIVARMKKGRGHRLLLEAWAAVVERLPQARLILAGRGELERELRDLARRSPWGGSVVFIGYRRDLQRVYRALDLKVLLSPGNDGTCRAALQALASGVPVLASDRGALPEIVSDGQTGRVVPRGSREVLAQVLADLLSNRGLLADMGRRARAQAQDRFTIRRQVDETNRLYRLVAAGGTAGGTSLAPGCQRDYTPRDGRGDQPS